MISFLGTPSEAQRLADDNLTFRAIAKAVESGLRVAMPGIIGSFDSDKQTVTVDIAVYDRILTGLPSIPNYNPATGDIKIPTLLDVPIVIPRAGGAALTFPVQAGDECLVIFTDFCINTWYNSGGINNAQERLRRHDLSDGFAILGPWSQPRVLSDYSTTQAQLRTDDGTVFVGIDTTGLTLKGLLKLSGAPIASGTLPDHSLLVEIAGVPYYLKLSTTP